MKCLYLLAAYDFCGKFLKANFSLRITPQLHIEL